MVDTTSIIVSVLSLVGAVSAVFFTAYMTYAADERKRNQEIKTQVRKYSDPLLITAHDLQDRLWQLLDTEMTYNDRKKGNGAENLELFTCYLFAQFLTWTHILKIKAQYLAFHEDKSTSGLRTILYKISDELSTSRYPENGQTFRLWPGHQLGIAENMISQAVEDGDIRPLGWHKFKGVYEDQFGNYFSWMRRSITKMLNAKYDKAEMIPDQRLRRIQHLLIDLIETLDKSGQVQADRKPQRCGSAIQCDCLNPECDGVELAKLRFNRSRHYKDAQACGQEKEGEVNKGLYIAPLLRSKTSLT